MISFVFGLSRNIFIFECLLLLVFLLAALILMIGVHFNGRWAWSGLLIFFELNLINQLFLYTRTFVFMDFVLPMMVSVLGFLIALIKLGPKEEEFEEYEPGTEETAEEPEVVEAKVEGEKKAESDKKVKAEHKPGKFIASKTGSVYHAPKCDWANKIKAKNRVWLNSDAEAKKQGYKKHSCLK